ncbi:hypothetical protein [Stackebrandtia soli]|uniref:hypothetical protein n=1 Tax=Stackebrandtia soli TaxID=1892856 RepID=UPI0039E87501
MVARLPELRADDGLFRAPGQTDGPGTVQNTYHAVQLASTVDRTKEIVTAETVRTLRALWSAGLPEADVVRAASIMVLGGHEQPEWTEAARDILAEVTARSVTRDTVLGDARLLRMAPHLGAVDDFVEIEPFPIENVEDRHLAWSQLMLADDVSRHDLAPYTDTLSRLPQDLARPENLRMPQLQAALHLIDGEVPDDVDHWFVDVKGCEGFPELYRLSLDETACSLEASVLALELGYVQ